MSVTEDVVVQSPGKVLYQLLVEAQAQAFGDRRTEVRFAFFRPVTVRVDGGEPIPAFTREISGQGIGLVHKVNIPRGMTELTIATEQGYSVRIPTEILWCQECGQGWFISGGRFDGIAVSI